MKETKYMREGRGVCKKCARELDVVTPIPARQRPVAGMDSLFVKAGPVISRHLNRIEEYGPRGAVPGGFCPGSLDEFDPVRTPEAPRAKKRR